jgi:hypothetical protein
VARQYCGHLGKVANCQQGCLPPTPARVGTPVSGGVNMYWNRRDESRRGELAVGAETGDRQCP